MSLARDDSVNKKDLAIKSNEHEREEYAPREREVGSGETPLDLSTPRDKIHK